MKAALLTGRERIEIQEIPDPTPAPHQIVLRPTGVGICGTDRHIVTGHANYHYDAGGRPIPVEIQPQILGHEISGVIMEVGREVRGLRAGDRVVVDQGLNCHSQQIAPVCEFCHSGDSHQCLHYREHGITGVQGAFAEYLAIAGVNAVPIGGNPPPEEVALTEPLACVLHAVEFAERSALRYKLRGETRARNVLILGAGPAGLLFLQYLRGIVGYEDPVYVADINAEKLRLAASFDAVTIHATGADLVREVHERTRGERIPYLVEATGAGPVFEFLPGLLRKQATVVLYGHGHEGADLSLLNDLQFLEPSLVCPIGASGGFDSRGRPLTYLNAMRHLVEGRIRVSGLVTDTCRLDSLSDIFARRYGQPDFIKAVLLQD